MAVIDLIQQDVENLRATVPELRGVVLATNDGQPLTYSLSPDVEPHRIAAMAAAASSLGKRVSDSLQVGALHEISLSSSEGQVFLYNAGGKGVLAVIGPSGINTGLIHLEARWAAREIGERMS
jgi:predicted regulator of Ras-like GTPase activity (Roadblock/LC7/MglB family)